VNRPVLTAANTVASSASQWHWHFTLTALVVAVIIVIAGGKLLGLRR
jgi:hypothetical protein